jgi:hypothetical protein
LPKRPTQCSARFSTATARRFIVALKNNTVRSRFEHTGTGDFRRYSGNRV